MFKCKQIYYKIFRWDLAQEVLWHDECWGQGG